MKNHPPTFAIACSLVCGVNLMSPFAVFGGDSRPSPPDSASSSRSALSLRWENDTIAGQDENYSNGISLALTRSGQSWLGGIWNLFGADGDRYLHGYDFGQIIVTPADINRTVPDPNDRPYSGLLYFAASTHLIRENRFHGLKFITGVVGPYSFAEETQREVHRLGGSAIPQGWDYQLETEPIFNMVYEHRRRYDLFQTESGFGFQVIPMAGAMLGNVLIQGQAGAQLRLGYNLPDDFGTTLMRGPAICPSRARMRTRPTNATLALTCLPEAEPTWWRAIWRSTGTRSATVRAWTNARSFREPSSSISRHAAIPSHVFLRDLGQGILRAATPLRIWSGYRELFLLSASRIPFHGAV